MTVLIRYFVSGLTVVIGLLVSLSAPLAIADAQEAVARACASPNTTPSRVAGPLASNGGHLLPSDGTGFFTDDLRSMAVRSSSMDESIAATTDLVAQDLTDFYFATDVEVFVNLPGTSTRAVIVDGDIAVPGHPTVFTIGGVQTLYLHWTTAVSDIELLLDTPSFTALTVSCNPPLALPDDDPDNVLAYVDDEPDVAAQSTRSGPTLPRTPLGDTRPSNQLPAPLIAAALAVTAGGVVLHQRDKIWGERYAPDVRRGNELMAASQPSLPVADLPPAMPRQIVLDQDTGEPVAEPAPSAPAPERTPSVGREIDLHVDLVESPLGNLVEKISSSAYGIVLKREEFARQVTAEWERHQHGGTDGAVVSLVLSELDALRQRLGADAAAQLFDEVADLVAEITRKLDLIGRANENEIVILMRNVDEPKAADALDRITKKIAATTFEVAGERVLITPASGFALLSDTQSAPDLIRAVEHARALSMLNLHLDPERWGSTAEAPHAPSDKSGNWRANLKSKLRTPFQIFMTLCIAWVLPFLAYVFMDAIGLDISYVVYIFLVLALVVTGAFILAEGWMAIDQKEPPELEPEEFPKATALIAAYMPNEAETVIETIDAFLAMDYPNDLQIILAYNTPDPMDVEEELDRIAAKHPNFVPVRVVGSTSKAQNVNAALSMATGEFIGMFDADHQPRPDAFTRAWRWIADGYDVVQGHCLTRNGDECFLAKMIAVEFESIYSVAHPGRAKMHRFGVFGGSNGFWRTELLHETRMRGSMLTEDIDSSMRVVERGFKIRSDRDLVSRELATTTFKQIWNQRMRWAQGWFQVSLAHMKLAFRSKELTFRQKLGLFHLLMWREFYPWLSQQLFPLVAFWAVRAGGLGRLDWTIPIFLASTIFTFSVGPLQAVFAYKLADQEIKQHKSWFWMYLFFNTFFYTEYKNLIARVAHVKQFMGESEWRVTPRSTGSDSA